MRLRGNQSCVTAGGNDKENVSEAAKAKFISDGGGAMLWSALPHWLINRRRPAARE